MSPEQATGDTVDGRSDLYSPACVLFEMLTGRPPFPCSQAMAIVAAHSAPPPRASDLNASVPERSGVIAKALRKRPTTGTPPRSLRRGRRRR